MRPVLFHVGGLPVYAYGLALTVAFAVGAWLATVRAPRYGLDPLHVPRVAAFSFLAALAGSRVLFLALEEPSRLLRPADLLGVWQGGLIFYGGFVAAVAASVGYAAWQGISFWTLADVIAPSIALGHGIVRLGCFCNGCCYGKPASWGIVFPALGDGVPRQPAQLYEAAAGAGILLVLLAWERRGRRVAGELLLVYVAIYGAVRFVLELLRDDDRGARLLGLTVSQGIAIAGVLLGTAWLLARRASRPRPAR